MHISTWDYIAKYLVILLLLCLKNFPWWKPFKYFENSARFHDKSIMLRFLWHKFRYFGVLIQMWCECTIIYSLFHYNNFIGSSTTLGNSHPVSRVLGTQGTYPWFDGKELLNSSTSFLILAVSQITPERQQVHTKTTRLSRPVLSTPKIVSSVGGGSAVHHWWSFVSREALDPTLMYSTGAGGWRTLRDLFRYIS